MFRSLTALLAVSTSAWAAPVLTVQVIDSNGAPLSGAEVYCVKAHPDSPFELPDGSVGRSDENGEVEFRHFSQGGRRTILVFHGDLAAGMTFTLGMGEGRIVKRLTPAPAKRYTGMVRDQYGNPVEGATILSGNVPMARTGAGGRYELFEVPGMPLSNTHLVKERHGEM